MSFHVQILVWYQTRVWTGSGQINIQFQNFQLVRIEKWIRKSRKNQKIRKILKSVKKSKIRKNEGFHKFSIFGIFIFQISFFSPIFKFKSSIFLIFRFFRILNLKLKSYFCPDPVQTRIWFRSGPDKIQIWVWTRKIPDSGRYLD